MARSVCSDVVLTHAGLAVNIGPNATITLYEAGTTDPLIETIYDSYAGAGTLSNPFNADSDGHFQFYLASPKFVKLVATIAGVGTVTKDYIPVIPDPATYLTTAGGVEVADLTLLRPKIKYGSYHDVRAFGNWHGGNISSATATATIGGGGVTAITPIHNGVIYSSLRVPKVVISGDGTGATATAVLDGNGYVTSVTVNTAGTGYTSATVAIQPVWTNTVANIAENTATLAAAIAAACSGSYSRALYIPDGVYLTNHIDLSDPVTGGIAPIFFGYGRLIPSIAVDGKVWINSAGSVVTFDSVGFGDIANPGLPKVGLLIGNSDTGGNSSNVHDFRKTGFAGFYSVAAVYATALNSSTFTDAKFSNAYATGLPSAFYASFQNAAGITNSDLFNGRTLSTTPVGVTNCKFTRSEFHADQQDLYGVVGTGHAVRLENASGFTFDTCPISSKSYPMRLDIPATPGPTPGKCTEITVINSGLYPETGTQPVGGIYIDNPSLTGTIRGLTLLNVARTTTTALLLVGDATTLEAVNIVGCKENHTASSIIAAASGSITITGQSKIDCAGLNVNAGASGNIVNGVLYQPGTVTAATDNSLHLGSAGQIRVKSGILEIGSAPPSSGGIRVSNTMAIVFNTDPGGSGFIGFIADSDDNFNIGMTTVLQMMNFRSSLGMQFDIGSDAGVARVLPAFGLETLKGLLGTQQGSSPTAPSAGKSIIYPGTDGNWYKINNGGSGIRLHDFAHYNYSFHVTHNANQTVNNSTITPVAFNTERYDDGSMHSTVTNNSRVTVPVAGKYLLIGSIRWGNLTLDGNAILQIRLNGSTMIGENWVKLIAGSNFGIIVVTQWSLAANDYVELIATQFTGNNDPIVEYAANNSPNFFGFRVGA